jgi:hypothetical protein
MPDHCHAMIAFAPDRPMSEAIRGWKRGTARLQGVRWQENFFDHRLRHDTEADECWTYLRNNPVVKNLAPTPEAWPWQWSPTPEAASEPTR